MCLYYCLLLTCLQVIEKTQLSPNYSPHHWSMTTDHHLSPFHWSTTIYSIHGTLRPKMVRLGSGTLMQWYASSVTPKTHMHTCLNTSSDISYSDPESESFIIESRTSSQVTSGCGIVYKFWSVENLTKNACNLRFLQHLLSIPRVYIVNLSDCQKAVVNWCRYVL